MSLGKNIKTIRLNKGITQADLAESLSVTVRTIQNYESDNRNPGLDTLKRISEYLHVNIDTLTCNESFDTEILNRAMQIALKHLPPNEDDVFMILGHYADYDKLLSFYPGGADKYLSPDCLKGLLNFISEYSVTEFNRIYFDLVETNVYSLNDEISTYCQKLYIQNINPLDLIAPDDLDLLSSLGYIKDGKVDLPLKNTDKDFVMIKEGGFMLDKIKAPFICKEHIGNLINYRCKNFDFSTLTDEDFDIILKDTLDFLEFELFKLGYIKQNNNHSEN